MRRPPRWLGDISNAFREEETNSSNSTATSKFLVCSTFWIVMGLVRISFLFSSTTGKVLRKEGKKRKEGRRPPTAQEKFKTNTLGFLGRVTLDNSFRPLRQSVDLTDPADRNYSRPFRSFKFNESIQGQSTYCRKAWS